MGGMSRQRWYRGVIPSIMSIALSLVPAVGIGAATSSASSLTNTVIYVGHGVEVIDAFDADTGCSSVYLTTNFTHWNNVTPSLKGAHGKCLYAWNSAAFVSPRVGWLLARDEAGYKTVLERTVNGGASWTRQPNGDTGSMAGEEVIGFVNAADGWRQQFSWAGNSNTLERTTDGGTKWRTVASYSHSGCPDLSDVFASSSVGFAASPLAGASSDVFSTNFPYVWRTLDGGVTWKKMSVTRPTKVPAAAPALYGQPAFTGIYGTLPVVFSVGGHQDVFFYASRDHGLHWKLIPGLASPLVVKGSIIVNSQTASGGCGVYTSVRRGPLVSVDVVSPSTWWVLRPGPKGDTERYIVTNGSVSSYRTVELPATTHRALLEGVNARDALLTVGSASGALTIYSTIDGGATWVALAPPTNGTSGFTLPQSKPPFG